MKVVILAGGFGTRLAEETGIRPKPMIEIGGSPILWHILKYYDAFGFSEFVLALGYKADLIKRYFLDYYQMAGNISLNFKSGQVNAISSTQENWKVHLVDTGVNTMTGGRLKRLRSWLGDEPFMLTYGDGVSDVDIHKLLDYHHNQGKQATITAVRPPARFGELAFQNGMVSKFNEKPLVGDGWINGGFMVLEPGILDILEGDDSILERDGLEKLAAEGQLSAYRHAGFWQCMDTLNDKNRLEKLWLSGNPPWKIWENGAGPG